MNVKFSFLISYFTIHATSGTRITNVFIESLGNFTINAKIVIVIIV